jgi:hypothetical protein
MTRELAPNVLWSWATENPGRMACGCGHARRVRRSAVRRARMAGRQAERRDREADQARLIVTEPNEPENFRDERVVVCKHSDAPIFDVTVSLPSEGIRQPVC